MLKCEVDVKSPGKKRENLGKKWENQQKNLEFFLKYWACTLLLTPLFHFYILTDIKILHVVCLTTDRPIKFILSFLFYLYLKSIPPLLWLLHSHTLLVLFHRIIFSITYIRIIPFIKTAYLCYVIFFTLYSILIVDADGKNCYLNGINFRGHKFSRISLFFGKSAK